MEGRRARSTCAKASHLSHITVLLTLLRNAKSRPRARRDRASATQRVRGACRPILHMVRQVVIKPLLGRSGTHGLVNAIWTLIGFAMKSREYNYSLVLPWFVASAAHIRNESRQIGNEPVPFERLFLREPFVRSLGKHGVRVIDHVPAGAKIWQQSSIAARAMQTYLTYASLRLEGKREQDPLEDAVYFGLQPAERIAAAVSQFQETLNAHGGAYGCLHARIESDIVALWRYIGYVQPPTLGQMLKLVGCEPELTQPSMRAIFVAVGDDISRQQQSTLARKTMWGAEPIRRPRRLPGWERVTYVEAATFDFQVCREASWFVGWSGSSFSLLLGRLRQLERKQHWLSYCKGGLVRHEANDTKMRSPKDNTCKHRHLKNNTVILRNRSTIAGIGVASEHSRACLAAVNGTTAPRDLAPKGARAIQYAAPTGAPRPGRQLDITGNCSQLVPKPTDAPPIRSPQAAHSVVAEHLAGKDLVEIGTRTGDGMHCFAQIARSAVAVEMDRRYCTRLRSLASSLPRTTFTVACQRYQAGLPDADVYTWWQQKPHLTNSCLLRFLRSQVDNGTIRRGAEAVLLFDLQAPKVVGDSTSWRAIEKLVTWSRRVPFNEKAFCLSKRIPSSMCRRAKGEFLVASIPVARVPTDGLGGLGDPCNEPLSG